MPFNFLNQGQTDDTATKFQPIDTFIDPVSKIRVSNPANLIDTDFEYGLQPTKWETVEIINNTPAFFSKSGDTTISDITGVTTNGGTREITINTAFPHLLDVGIPIRVSGTKSVTADGSYIINATPTPTTFTYLARANQPETISIFDLYTSIITGEFFQGSQISISDAEGMTTDGVGPNSKITIKTANKHGFGPKTPFYFLNLNSTVSQEFESTNSTSLSFDPTNSATAQSFDGSNTLLQTPVDLSNSATTSEFQNNISSTNSTDATITVSIASGDENNWDNLVNGSPLYYDVNIGSGYFQENPRGVVFIKDISLIDVSNNTATFQVSENPDDAALPILANMTGYFQIADQARTFAGNNVNPDTQITFDVEIGQEYVFDGGNQGYDGTPDDFTGNPPSNNSTVVGYTGTSVSVFTAEGSLDYYVGAMLKYETDGTPATGLQNNATYFVTSFSTGASAGLFTMSISEFPGENSSDINISGGSGTQTFSKIGVSVDKDIIHVKDSNFQDGDMLEYTYPNDGSPGNFNADEEKMFYFVQTAYDQHNYVLSAELFTPTSATGGDVVTEIDAEGRSWKVHQFTSLGTSDFTVNAVGSEPTVEYLIVAGGGGGGGRHGGGGGAGGLLQGSFNVSASNYSITVGDGGLGAQNDTAGSNGSNSSAFGLTAIGGGGGGSYGSASYPNGRNGGSGGGGGHEPSRAGSGTAGQGNAGGNGISNEGGGGGGAGQVGDQARNGDSIGGDGGDGLQVNIDGNNYYWAGGGGGASWSQGGSGAGNGGRGGGGGGGHGAGTVPGYGDTNGINPGADGLANPSGSNVSGGNGGANTGGGGGGLGQENSGSYFGTGGNGGSGIVIVRYITGTQD